MNLVKKIGLAYIRGIDATVRFIGSYVIMGILILMIHGVSLAVSYLPFVAFDSKEMTAALSLILLPLIVRLGVLAGGLSIPPICWKKQTVSDNT